MDNVDVKSIIAILTFLAGAGSAVLGMLRWFATAEKKKYAAEREFGHLKRNQEQMQQTLKSLSDDFDEMSADLKTQTALFKILMDNSGQTISGIFAHRDRHGETP